MTRGSEPCALDVGLDDWAYISKNIFFDARFVFRARNLGLFGDGYCDGGWAGSRQDSALNPPKGIIPFGIPFAAAFIYYFRF